MEVSEIKSEFLYNLWMGKILLKYDWNLEKNFFLIKKKIKKPLRKKW